MAGLTWDSKPHFKSELGVRPEREGQILLVVARQVPGHEVCGLQQQLVGGLVAQRRERPQHILQALQKG